MEDNIISVYDNYAASVVYISTLTKGFSLLSFQSMEVPRGSGSGSIWSDKGYILTNYHVIEQAIKQKPNDEIVITFLNSTMRTELKATVHGYDDSRDIAVLYIKDYHMYQHLFKPIKKGISSNLRIGQFVVAIGNPFGLEQTLTTGVISGLNRIVATSNSRNNNKKYPLFNTIQIDAAINPGNSGGPLFNKDGEVIGMNTAIISNTGAFSGIGFSIPIDTLSLIVDKIIEKGGSLRRAYLGFDVLPAKLFGYKLGGLIVLSVAANSPAADAGLRSVGNTISTTSSGNHNNNISIGNGLQLESINYGDIVTAVNGANVSTESDFLAAIDMKVSCIYV